MSPTSPARSRRSLNDDFKNPQKIESLPVALSGRLEKAGDVDSFAITLKEGEPFAASVEAFVLGSPFDGLLRLVDAEGTQLAFNHDGRTLDPKLSFTAPRAGTYVLQIMGFGYPPSSNVGFVGNENCLYRLRLRSGFEPRTVFPATEIMDQYENEPNDSAELAGHLSMPSVVNGAIAKEGDEDRFAFTAIKGTSYELTVLAARAGSPLHALLKIESPDGKALAKEDGDGRGRDPKVIVYKAPTDGRYLIAISDLTHRGSPEHQYRLTLREAAPSISATAANHAVSVSAEKRGELKVTVKRANGFKAPLLITAKDLPPGVSAPEVDVPEKDGDVVLKFAVADGAAPVSQPLHVVLREKESGTEHPVRYFLPGSDKADPAAPMELVIESTEVLWLTLPEKPEPPAPVRTEPAK